MTTPQLLDYVSAQLKAGASRDVITKALIGQGWTQADVSEAFDLMPKSQPPVSSPAPFSFTPAAASPATSPATFSSPAAQPRIINQLERPDIAASPVQPVTPVSMPASMPVQQPRQFTPPLQSFTPPIQQPTMSPIQPRTFTPPMQQPSFQQPSPFQPQQQSPMQRQFTGMPTASPMMTPNDAQRKALMRQKAPQSRVLFSLLIFVLGILIGAAGVFAYYTLVK